MAAALRTAKSRIASESVGLRSRGHLDLRAESEASCDGERGSPLLASHWMKAGRVSRAKCSG
eukprot:251567-Pleurochrysis_carterae.AAC.2